ncbi:hypothetical protein [Rhodococcus sp. EPR-157]|jgi:hypothetical protein|uniref:hypothetical protein n=1 Tax=Rhodococcus sp. EPR-157 TaxID=1813677 RepID=UPI000A8B30E9|nr:hypothetical protein [Rhodococcus sp. EPR-157]
MLIDLSDRDLALHIDPRSGGAEQRWHPQTEGHLLHETASHTSAQAAPILVDTLTEQTPHVWMLTAPSPTPMPRVHGSDTSLNHIQIMEAVWRFTIQRVSLVDSGQAAAQDFTPAYLVVEPLKDIVDALTRTHRRSLQQLSSIARRGHDGNVYLAAFTSDITSARIPHELRKQLLTLGRLQSY